MSVSTATHCIPWDSTCTICNPNRRINPDGWDGEGNWPNDDGENWPDYEYDDGPSISRMALMYDEGKVCGECFAEFTEANGIPSSCEYCKRRGSELPLSKHPELNTEAHKSVARRRRKNKQRSG